MTIWEDWDGNNWKREPCMNGSLRLHCSYCCDNILEYFKDCEDKESETVYLLTKSCAVQGTLPEKFEYYDSTELIQHITKIFAA